MTLGLIDLILAIVVVISVLFALYRGLVRELLGIAAWILAGFAALYSYAPLQPLMNKMIENKTTAGIVGSLVVALLVLVIMTLINSWITKRLRQSALSGLDRILGLMFGIGRAGLLAAICYLGASMFMPEQKLNEMEEQNISVPYVRTMAGWLEYVIPDNIKADIKEYEQGKLNDSKTKKIGIDLKKTVKEQLIEYRESDKQSLDDMIDKIADE
ncbi:MAG: CvpA family protein [Alphaproteobacteria bacterium]|nr:CvpA family protein [Alphaproteobacteria bacterium]